MLDAVQSLDFSLIHSFNKFALTAYYGPGTVLDTRDIAVTRKGMDLEFMALKF